MVMPTKETINIILYTEGKPHQCSSKIQLQCLRQSPNPPANGNTLPNHDNVVACRSPKQQTAKEMTGLMDFSPQNMYKDSKTFAGTPNTRRG